LCQASRVTRWVCDKIAQNVAQRFFMSKLMHKLNHGKKVAQNVGNFFNLKKLNKVNNQLMFGNWPNLVTLKWTHRTNVSKGRISGEGVGGGLCVCGCERNSTTTLDVSSLDSKRGAQMTSTKLNLDWYLHFVKTTLFHNFENLM
jgi:hypothetical protein